MRKGWVLAVLVLFTALSLAQQPAVSVQQLDKDARVAFNLGDYDKAIELWKQAYGQSQQAVFLLSLGSAYQKKADYRRAAESFKAYVREVPSGAYSEKAKSLAEENERLWQEEQARIAASTPDAGPAPPPRGADAGVSADAQGMGVAPLPPKPGSPGKTLRLVGLITAGAGIVLTGVGVSFALKASSQKSELEDAAAKGEVWGEKFEDLESSRSSNASIGAVMLGVGVAAIAGGTVMWVLGRRAAKRGAEVVPAAGPDQASIIVRGTW